MAAVARVEQVQPGDYVRRAEAYVADVVSGKRPACKLERSAVARYLSDKRQALRREWPYYFDVDAAERPCEFIEMLPHVKGKWKNRKQLIHLEGWQCFIVINIFGWLGKPGRSRAGLRRFLEAYLEIPRKNGKSILAAAIGLYLWSMDQEAGAEIYSGATSEKQAWEVFRPARQMVIDTPALMGELGGDNVVRAKSLIVPQDQSRFEPMIGKPGDGASVHAAIIDEYHEHATSDMVDTMRTGMMAREQPLLLQITTAGSNLAGPCYDKHLDVEKLLDGSFINETLFCIIFSIDEGDDWTKPEALVKANPNYNVSVDAEILATMHRAAVLNPVEQVAFKTKHLNIWCAARTIWMPLEVWDPCGDAQLHPDEFKGEEYYAILDLASKDDIAAYTRMFQRVIDGKLHYYFFSRYYLPQTAVELPSPNQVAYRRWAAEKWLTLTPGEEIDFSRIEADVLADKNHGQIIEVLYDPWRATQLAQGLEKSGAITVELRHTVQNFSLPMKELLSAAKAGRAHHDRNPVSRWMMSNVTAQVDAKDNIYPRKEKPYMKIDGPVTMIMGVSRGMLRTGGTFESWLAASPVVVRK